MKNWLKDEEKIRSLKLSKKACRYGKAKFPVIERELFTKFFDMRIEGKRVKRWCFNSKASELVKQKYLDEASSFKLSHRWFEDFCRRYRISLWRKTHAAQKSPAALCTAIERFHHEQEHKRGIFTLTVMFQPKIWCDEAIVKKSVEED